MSQGTLQFDSYQIGGTVFLEPPVEQSAKQARDEAIEQVLTNAGDDWRERALQVIRETPASFEFIGEDIRLSCEENGIRPHHPNAWGGLIASAVKAGLIVATGEYRTPKSKNSHARKSQVYRRVS